MSIRIESFVFSPTVFLLPLAFAFFAILSWRALYPALIPQRSRAWGALAAMVGGGLAGAWLYARVADLGGDASSSFPVDLRLGSFGGYWGVLVAAGLMGRLFCGHGLRTMDRVLPAMLFGAAVSRIGCLFNGCCRGLHITCPIQPFVLWPFYDLAAIALAGWAINVLPRRLNPWSRDGGTLVLFFWLYSPVRFLLEFLRDTPSFHFGLTIGQVAALAQFLLGAAGFLMISRFASASSPEANS